MLSPAVGALTPPTVLFREIRIEKTKELIDYAGKDTSCVCFSRNFIV
jgi:hypothetical protein